MKTRIATIVAAAIAPSFAAQNSWSEDAPVDCSTAQEDLSHLKHEKLSTMERMG
jgi:hypothetical protein